MKQVLSSEIFIADLIRCWHVLAPQDPLTKRHIQNLLAWEDFKHLVDPSTKTPSQEEKKTNNPQSEKKTSETPNNKSEEKNNTYSAIKSKLYKEKNKNNTIQFTAQLLPPSLQKNAESLELHLPLFNPKEEKNILLPLITTAHPMGRINISVIIDQISRHELIKRIPREYIRTLSKGVTLFIDTHDSMDPFRKDYDHLLKILNQICGQEHINLSFFNRNPLIYDTVDIIEHGSITDRIHPGIPILVLTDLGIGKNEGFDSTDFLSAWLDFSELAHSSQCPLVFLIPYPESRWPLLIKKHLNIIQWDRNTSVSKAITTAKKDAKRKP